MSSRSKPPASFHVEFPPELPISARADEIIGLLQRNQVLVLAGETGSGKTTQIPKLCLAAGSGLRGRIACTQPRRVAAASVSRRVAEELNVPWGREVGCKIRFADQTSPETVIKFMTDGMLLAELQGDPELREYDTIIVDEAHERSLNIDFVLGHLRNLRRRRPELRIVITSATIDTEAFSKAFDDAPIVEVSGRVYPVEVIWSPLEEMKGDEGEFTYIDAAVDAVERVLRESSGGDMLVFLPTERDIRETRDLLEGRPRRDIEIVPLFGRLTNAEQQRVFAPTSGRKIVLATNIAETSLTIPGIRFVIDTGLARISRYVPQSRTRRLPIEPVAQSSADQRKGRCGRVSDGVCIRLYSEQDFNDRPRFAQPEIQRSNLADVILRMKAFGLGAIEEFPFLNAPPARGIRAGYALLEELGALVKDRGSSESKGEAVAPHGPSDGPRPSEDTSPYREYQLTELGRDLAHLPVDPTVGRMILQARQERAMHEVLVIAAALSIQDPRERPLDQQQKADAAHRRFVHPDSDFLTLLAIWDAYHDEFETMTLGKLRKFCTSHFLSFQRMREWRDIHAQLIDVISDRDGFSNSSVYDGLRKGQELSLAVGTPAYRAIHRSILTGLLGNVAIRADDGSWHAAHDRKAAVFPGSALFEKTEMKRKPSHTNASEDTSTRGKRSSRWLMAAEIMETGRLYARTCARIDPQWIVDLGGHVIRASHSEPFWSAEAGKVLVKERRRLYNLEIETRAVAYGRIDPAHATEIFIREGLVGDTITWPFDFFAHNRRLREKTEAVLTRTRSAGYLDLDEAAYRFYAARLGPEGDKANRAARAPATTAHRDASPDLGISSVPDLVDFVRHRQTTEPKFLFMSEEDLKPPAELVRAAAEFPESLPLENRALPLNYLYKPGQEDDGVTLRVTLAEVSTLTPAALDWAVPGHLREKIELMLKALPKEQRRSLIPLAEASAGIADRIGLIAARSPTPSLAEALAEILTDRLGLGIDPRLWEGKSLPEHLRVRVEVVDHGGVVLAAGRELKELQDQLGAKHQELSRRAVATDSTAWRAARAKWEKPPALEWNFGDLPESIVVAEHAGVPVLAWPGLQVLEAGVGVRLFASSGEAAKVTRRGLAKLFESVLRYDLGWLEKDLRDLRALGTLAVTLVSVEQMRVEALQAITRWICDADRMGLARPPGARKDAGGTAGREDPPYQLKKAAFEKALHGAKAELRGLVPKVVDWLREALTLRLALQTHKTPYPGLEEDLTALLPANFIARTPYERWPHLARYLKGMQLRADRWKRDPAKDAQRTKELEPFVRALRQLGDRAGEFRWLVEEFRVSLFAQELGTAGPVSAVRLQKALEETEAILAGTPVGGRDKPATIVPLPTKGRTVLKSLDALGNLKR